MNDGSTVTPSPEAPAQVGTWGLVGKSQEAVFTWLLRETKGVLAMSAGQTATSVEVGSGPLLSAGHTETRACVNTDARANRSLVGTSTDVTSSPCLTF